MNICAIATQTGGALAIVRISGPQAVEISSEIFKPFSKTKFTEQPSHSIAHGTIFKDETQEPLDDVMAAVFRSPRSFTGEDTVEFYCHGSSYILNEILQLLITHGCRMAEPGEFTKRAFLAGKLDLSQAEAVADLIASSNSATHQLAMSALRGNISSKLASLRLELLRLTSLLELELDFSDHEDIEFADRTELSQLAQTAASHIAELAESFKIGQAVKNGVYVAIVGKTNVGKSTLLNQLLKEERAIVSDTHGTTRDTIEDTITIDGITFRFVDTAGLRRTNDEIEQLGIERTWKTIEKAQIVLWVVDAPPTSDEVEKMVEATKNKTLLLVKNKADLQPVSSSPYVNKLPSVNISAKQGSGISDLEKTIRLMANIPQLTENTVIITSARHYDALMRAHSQLNTVLHSLTSNAPSVLIAEDLRQVIRTLGEITGGEITSNETLQNIFSHFCVGK